MDARVQDVQRVVTDTWRSLTPHERQPYEMVAQQDLARFAREKRQFEELQRRYTELRFAAEQDGAPPSQSLLMPFQVYLWQSTVMRDLAVTGIHATSGAWDKAPEWLAF